jgi:membrane protein
LILLCGGLALLSVMFSAVNGPWLSSWAGGRAELLVWLQLFIFKLAAVPLLILALFLTYWLLPNRRIDPRRVAPAAIIVGLALESLKYVNLLIWPMLKNKLEHEYNIFKYSVTIVLWSFVGAMVVLAGAHWTASAEPKTEPPAPEWPPRTIT